MSIRTPVLVLAAGLGLAAVAAAQTDWQAELEAELLIMEDCTLSFLTQVVEREVDGRVLLMAKAHCEDGRAFDATRTDSFEPFDLRACEPEDAPAAC